MAASAFAAAPIISSTTIWPDTTYAGPYTIRTVITCDEGIGYVALGYCFNPTDGPWSWPYNGYLDPNDNWIEEYTQSGDTFYFDIPAIPAGLETPVVVGYSLWADNASYTGTTEDPGSNNYYSFLNTIYTPDYSNVTVLRDTFFTGPYVVKANITTAYGDSVKDDYIYTDLGPGDNYFRDSLGVDGFYYYSIPRMVTNTKTPINVQWFLAAYDTMNNLAQWPVKRDSMNHFTLTDPSPSNTSVLTDTSILGPFVVWTDYVAEGNIINDSLWVYNGADWSAYGRDSMVGNRYFYTIPVQDYPVKNSVLVQWFLKATDDLTGNYTYVPSTVSPPSYLAYSFRIYDRTPPMVTNTTWWDNTLLAGPYEVLTNCWDTSGISQVRLNYRTKPNADTAWNYLPMFATGNPHEYRANIPTQYPGTMIQYFISARDSTLKIDGTIMGNTGYAPNGAYATPHSFFAGEPDYKLLLVNDALSTNEFQSYYTSCLDTNGLTYGYWDNRADDALPELHNFNTLIWFTGDDSVNTLSQSDRDSLVAFLDRGGNLLLSSKNLGQNLGGLSSDTVVFYHDYLKARFDSSTVLPTYVTTLKGQSAFPISRGVQDSLFITTIGTAGNYKSVDRIFPLAGADSVFTFKTKGGSGVIRCSTGVYKAVYASIPLEALGKNTVNKVSRTEFIGRVMRWFGVQAFYKVEDEKYEVGVTCDKSILNPAYPNPFGQATTISFNLPSDGYASLKIYNVLGQVIKTVTQGQKSAGLHKVTWNGDDESGRKVANGIYLYRLVTDAGNLTQKVIVLR
jgi:hypothetical protein